MGDLRDASLGCGPLDARENVAFEGRDLAWWVHDRYPRVGLRAGAGVQEDLHGRVDRRADADRLRCAQDGLAAALPGLHDELEKLR